MTLVCALQAKPDFSNLIIACLLRPIPVSQHCNLGLTWFFLTHLNPFNVLYKRCCNYSNFWRSLGWICIIVLLNHLTCQTTFLNKLIQIYGDISILVFTFANINVVISAWVFPLSFFDESFNISEVSETFTVLLQLIISLNSWTIYYHSQTAFILPLKWPGFCSPAST